LSLWLSSQDSLTKAFFGGIETNQLKFRKLMSPWFRYLLAYSPEKTLQNLRVPFLILNGEKDTQVLAKLNTEGFRKIFERNNFSSYKIITYPNLNHFFQNCKTGFMDEVESIEETISPNVLADISKWIKEQVIVKELLKKP
jgi:uncharacterized protein